MTSSWPAPSPAATADRTTGSGASPRILAVGTGGGVTSGFVGVPAGGFVRAGSRMYSLSEDEYQLWDASQLAPAAGPLLEQAGHGGVADAAAVLAELEAARLVLTYTGQPGSWRSLAAGLTIRLTGRLIGNGPHQSPSFLVASSATAPQVQVDPVVYQALLWADGRTSIAGLCSRIDTRAAGPAFDAAQHVVSWIPRLMRTGLIKLDLAEPLAGGPQ
jgi:hypothetical protein